MPAGASELTVEVKDFDGSIVHELELKLPEL